MTTGDLHGARPSADECTRCRAGRLRPWSELSAEERTVVERLPASADYTLSERRARHLWCTRCWHESTRDAREA